MDETRRAQMREMLEKRLNEGLNEAEREELQRVHADQKDVKSSLVRIEVISTVAVMKAVRLATTPDIVVGLNRALSDFAVTCKIPKEQFMEMVSTTYDQMLEHFTKEHDSIVDRTLDMVEARGEALGEILGKMPPSGKPEDSLKELTSGLSEGQLITLPKNWDKSIN